ncbi:class I SAM-dependent methyltransferase, partial [Planococcus sp. SIMBA_143]
MLKTDGTLLITVQPRGDEERDSKARVYGAEISQALQNTGFKNITVSYKDANPSLTVSVKGVK